MHACMYARMNACMYLRMYACMPQCQPPCGGHGNTSLVMCLMTALMFWVVQWRPGRLHYTYTSCSTQEGACTQVPTIGL